MLFYLMIVYFLEGKRKLGESMNKKIITAIVLLACLAFVPFTSADYPTGELGYSDEIQPGNEYKWTLSKYEFTGDFADMKDYYESYISYYGYGDMLPKAGDIYKVVILADPDTATDVWYELYINDVLVPEAGYLYTSFSYYGFTPFLILPTTYTNATGTYNIYEQMLEEIEPYFYDDGDSYSTVYNGYTFSGTYSQKITIEEKGSVMVLSVYMYQYATITGGYTELTSEIEVIGEATINTQTGLFGYLELSVEATTDYMSGSVHIKIDSPYGNAPYNWAYSFLGITVIAAVVALAKRKRN